MLACGRQSLRPERGVWKDVGFSLHLYTLDASGVPVALDARAAADCIRALQGCPRVREPRLENVTAVVRDAEALLLQSLRKPTLAADGERTWHAAWPVAVAILVP